MFGNVTRSLLIPDIVGPVAGFIDIVEGPKVTEFVVINELVIEDVKLSIEIFRFVILKSDVESRE